MQVRAQPAVIGGAEARSFIQWAKEPEGFQPKFQAIFFSKISFFLNDHQIFLKLTLRKKVVTNFCLKLYFEIVFLVAYYVWSSRSTGISQNQLEISQIFSFALEMNPESHNVLGNYIEPPACSDALVEPFPAAKACRFIWTGQRPVYHIFLKLVRAAGGLAWCWWGGACDLCCRCGRFRLCGAATLMWYPFQLEVLEPWMRPTHRSGQDVLEERVTVGREEGWGVG